MNFLHIGVVLLLANVLTQTNATPHKGPILDDYIIVNSAREAKKLVDKAYLQTRTNLKAKVKRETARFQDMKAFTTQAVGTTRNAIRSADYLEMTLQVIAEKLKKMNSEPFNVSDLLTPEQNAIVSQLTGCAYKDLPKECDSSPYRTINGECNNRKNPILGASNTGVKRLLPPEYEDGISLPRGWTPDRPINGHTLPLARNVSNVVVKFSKESLVLDDNRSFMFMQWGQFQDHDTDLSPDVPSRTPFFEGTDCEASCVQSHPCFPIMIPPNDPRYVNGSECIPMFRHAPVCSLINPLRVQINVVTAYTDASQVYGSDNKVATLLRNNTNDLGLLAVNQQFTDNGLSYLPFTKGPTDICTKTNETLGIPCFLAGDVRVNEQTGLMVLHTLLLREHNRIATELHKLNPHWPGEKNYQESRKILGGMQQKMTYKDWLPLLLGDNLLKVLPAYVSYNEDEDPRIASVYTIAFRMGHATVPPVMVRLAEGYTPFEPEPVVPFHKLFFATYRIVTQGGIDPLLRGMIAKKAKLNRQNAIVVEELRNRLFEMVSRVSLDLASINMQRGRDLGLPGYNKWRRFCNLSAPQNVDELAVVLNNTELAEKLIDLYGTCENIDLWIGGICEPLVPGGRTGELFSCIIGNQFRRTRDGDWFFYENPSTFSPEQKASIESVTLSHIICANTNIKEVPQNVFLSNTYPQDFLNCDSFPAIDLQPWKDEDTDDEEGST
ncbi:myeloperoxidase-like isoform X1 [Dendropsophus ebraccatus]|uniref:myeloperoxidase-like isoform X1 n=1 Tax=Dendropsophus ebraccatus TaxID=150705 RepID=UPI003831301E